MAKDPAFLFYPGDWQLGTMHMTLLEKGCYMELLVLQFAKGKFTEAQAKHMLNGSFSLAWPTLREKFETDGTFFWNKRLELEKEKRKKFTDSRKSNGSIKKSDKHMPKHMENENINTNEDVSVLEILCSSGKWKTKPDKDFLEMDLDEVKAGAVKQLFKISKNQNLTNEQLKGLWYAFKVQNFTGEKFYASANDVYSHFINWSKNQTVNGSTENKSNSANGNAKLGTSDARTEALRKW